MTIDTAGFHSVLNDHTEDLAKTKVQRDPLVEWHNLLSQCFQGLTANLKTAWIAVASAYYEPGTDGYGKNKPTSPMFFHSVDSLSQLPALVIERALQLEPVQELGLNTTIIACMQDTGQLLNVKLPIWDGKPDLKTVKPNKYYSTLKTQNSYHFYANKRDSYHGGPLPLDQKWSNFKRIDCGYIRVTGNVKGPILYNPAIIDLTKAST